MFMGDGGSLEKENKYNTVVPEGKMGITGIGVKVLGTRNTWSQFCSAVVFLKYPDSSITSRSTWTAIGRDSQW